MTDNAEMRELWNGEATDAWAAHPDRYDVMLEPFSARVLEAADLQPGERVLDIGCGSGALARSAARAVSQSGHVTGLDIARPLIDLGRRRTADEELAQVDLVMADAQVDDLPGAPHDVVISRFGVMFFSDPEAAFANIRSATRPGGRLSFVCWQPLGDNEWSMVPVLAVMAHVGLPQPPAPNAPGPYAFADPDRVRSILTAAGWSDVAIDAHAVHMRVGGAATADDAVDFYCEDLLGKTLFADASSDARDSAVAALRDALSQHETPDGVHLGAAAWSVTARSPM